MNSSFDIQQVCENGHQITGCCQIHPERQKKFCPECGAATITACPSCHEKIPGDSIKRSESWVDARCGGSKMVCEYPADVPAFCQNCGKPYPWTENKIKTAIQIFAEFGGLDEEEKKTIKEDINNIARDIPQSELSALRIKKIWKKYGQLAYNIIMEFSSKTAANILKNP